MDEGALLVLDGVFGLVHHEHHKQYIGTPAQQSITLGTHHRQQTMEWIGIEQLQCKYYTCVTTISYSNSIPLMSIPIPILILQVMSILIVICVQLIYDGS